MRYKVKETNLTKLKKYIEVIKKQVSDKKTELVNAEPMRLLRVERDRLLAETDWMGNSDVTMSSDWKTYRTKLRDLPASAKPKLSADGSLDMSSVTFPTKPS